VYDAMADGRKESQRCWSTVLLRLRTPPHPSGSLRAGREYVGEDAENTECKYGLDKKAELVGFTLKTRNHYPPFGTEHNSSRPLTLDDFTPETNLGLNVYGAEQFALGL